jgi:hypothetical protein
MILKITFLYGVTSCSPIERYQRFGATSCLLKGDDGSSGFVQNVGNVVPDYTASHLRRQCLHTHRRENLQCLGRRL